MLNVWVNRPKDESLLVTNLDIVFMEYMDFSLLETDFDIEVMKNLSKADKICNPRMLTTKGGMFYVKCLGKSSRKRSKGCRQP